MSESLASHSIHNRLLTVLPPADAALLAPDLKEIALEQNEILFEPGDTVEYVHFPHTAIISLLVVMRDGQTVETATIGRSGLIGGVSGFGPWRAFARATVQVPGAAARIASARFRAAIKQSEFLRSLVLGYGQSVVAQIQQTAACNALHDVEERLCRWLLLTRDQTDSDIIPLTQESLAQMLGVRRTTVTLAASRLQTTGLIRYTQRGQIKIVNRTGLEKAACECYDVLRSQTDELVF
jgi:CRP-like cAMP-binding protein